MIVLVYSAASDDRIATAVTGKTGQFHQLCDTVFSGIDQSERPAFVNWHDVMAQKALAEADSVAKV